MKNFIQNGRTLDVSLDADVTSGDVVKKGVLVGVAAVSGLAGETIAVDVEGVFNLPVLSTDVVAVGDQLYWDADNSHMTKTDTSDTKAGYATGTSANGVVTVDIRLTPGAA